MNNGLKVFRRPDSFRCKSHHHGLCSLSVFLRADRKVNLLTALYLKRVYESIHVYEHQIVQTLVIPNKKLSVCSSKSTGDLQSRGRLYGSTRLVLHTLSLSFVCCAEWGCFSACRMFRDREKTTRALIHKPLL